MGDNKNMNLPPGFRFSPTDEELVVHFLQRKASRLPCHPDIIPDLGLYPYDPWDLDGKAMVEGNKWYYFSRRSSNRVTANGYWKSCGGDEEIMSSNGSKRIGVKKYYVFHVGEAPEGMKTDWIMQEFRVHDGANSSRSRRRDNSKNDWVICRVCEQNYDNDDGNDGMELSCLDEVFLSLDDYDDISFPN
ncbi:putative transcription factor NAM family [Helianthus annuus]|nr:putative transcription factor NAM family [Helianthus annuus]KAJ0734257.1 putative transcription factor NAM family [Helianthus annuus]